MAGRERAGGIEVAWDVLRRRAGIALTLLSAGAAATAGLVTALPSIYGSKVTVLVERGHPGAAAAGPPLAGEVEVQLQSLSQQILSRSRLNDLISQFDLYPRLRGRASPDELVDRFRRDIHMEVRSVNSAAGQPATIAFTLLYRGTEPDLVARVANQLASFFVEENTRVRARQAAGATEVVGTRLAEVRDRLAQEEARVRAFTLRYAGELPQQLGANLATLERLNAELQHNKDLQLRAIESASRDESRTRAVAVAAAPGDPLSTATRLERRRAELDQLRARYSDDFPEVIRARSEVEALETRLAAEEVGETSGGTPPAEEVSRSPEMPDIETLKAEEMRIRQAIASYQKRVEVAPEREQELRELTRDHEATRQLYAALVQRDEEARVVERTNGDPAAEQFRILDPALPAWNPVAPDRPRLLLLGLVLAAGLAAAAVALAERADTSFHSVDAVRAFTGVPLLATIPRIATRRDRRRRGWRLCLGSAGVIAGIGLIAVAAHRFGSGNEVLVTLLSRGGS